MTINFPSTKSIKDAIRQEIGRTAAFVIKDAHTACPVCSGADLYDSVNGLSLDQFCTTCSGSYWISQDIVSSIVAHVRWRTGDESDFGIAGESFTGDCTVTIDIDELSDDQLDKIKEIRVDDRNLEVFRTIKRGVPDRDRIRFLCREVGKT
jgi:hypothetical protein